MLIWSDTVTRSVDTLGQTAPEERTRPKVTGLAPALPPLPDKLLGDTPQSLTPKYQPLAVLLLRAQNKVT